MVTLLVRLLVSRRTIASDLSLYPNDLGNRSAAMLLKRKVLMNKRNSHASVAHAARVTRAEYSRQVRFQQEWRTRLRPGR